MGLAAQQARLLTITARKSDAEYKSMVLSNRKLSLANDMTNVSNEYQSALSQTKLEYDFYGNGSSEDLSYNTFMTPSALNDYYPITFTNSAGRTVLDTQMANAARAAGIPTEGLGCAPSTIVRDTFLQGLADSGVITQVAAEKYMSITYNQGLGIDSSASSLTYYTTTGTLDDLCDLL